MPRTRRINTWPALLDLLAVTLMVFVLVTFLQNVLDPDALEALAQRARLVERLEEALAEDIRKGAVKLEPKQKVLEVTFGEHVLFDKAEHELLDEGEALLRRVRKVLGTSGDAGLSLVQVEGHADPDPLQPTDCHPANNWQLSAARAVSVVELLVEDPHIDPRCLSATGYAWHHPVVANDTEANKQLNRRIEMRIFFAGLDAEARCGEPEERP